MSAACYTDRWKIIHRCQVAEDLYSAVFVAHDALLRDDTAEHREGLNACLQEYHAHVAKCIGGKDDQSKS